MANILDEDFVTQKEPSFRRRDLLGRALTLFMFVVGAIVMKYTLRSGEAAPWYLLMLTAFIFQLAAVMLGAIIHLFYKLLTAGRKFKFTTRLFVANSVIIGFFFWGLLVLILIFAAITR